MMPAAHPRRWRLLGSASTVLVLALLGFASCARLANKGTGEGNRNDADSLSGPPLMLQEPQPAGPAHQAHKPLLPLSRNDVAMVAIAAATLLLASGGGVGGGAIFVPLYILVGGFSTAHAVALSNVTVLGGACANIAVNMWRRHPKLSRPLIDWDLILVMEPTTVLGALAGGYLNKLLPVWIVSLLLAALLSFISWKLVKKGASSFRAESRLKARGLLQSPHRSPSLQHRAGASAAAAAHGGSPLRGGAGGGGGAWVSPQARGEQDDLHKPLLAAHAEPMGAASDEDVAVGDGAVAAAAAATGGGGGGGGGGLRVLLLRQQAGLEEEGEMGPSALLSPESFHSPTGLAHKSIGSFSCAVAEWVPDTEEEEGEEGEGLLAEREGEEGALAAGGGGYGAGLQLHERSAQGPGEQHQQAEQPGQQGQQQQPQPGSDGHAAAAAAAAAAGAWTTAQPPLSAQQQHHQQHLHRLLARDSMQLPLGKLSLMLALAACVVASDWAKMQMRCGSLEYWLTVLSVVPVAMGLALAVRHWLLKKVAARRAAGLTPQAGEVAWTPRNTLLYPAACTMAGLVAGMFGVGGGIIKAPLMLEMGVLPEVASATSATMIWFTAGAASVVYINLGAMVPDYAYALLGLAFSTTLAGQLALILVLRVLRRRSIIILMMATLLVTATVVAYTQGLANTAAALRQPDGMWRWGSLCGADLNNGV